MQDQTPQDPGPSVVEHLAKIAQDAGDIRFRVDEIVRMIRQSEQNEDN